MTDKSSAELERDAERVRAQISDTADQLRDRMTPGQLMDEALNQFGRGDASQLLVNLKNQARDNPMALALIGGGIAWLMMGSGSSGSGYDYDRDEYEPGMRRAMSYAEDPSTQAYSDRSGGMEDPYVGAGAYARGGGMDPYAESSTAAPPVESFGEAGQSESTGSGVGAAAASAGRAAKDALHAAGDRLRSATEGTGEYAQHAYERMRGAGTGAYGAARHAAYDVGSQARRTFVDVLEREPLVIGALGLAVGAAIGALLPATEMERQNLGATSAALKEKADEMVDAGMDAAKRAAGELYGAAREEADRQGLLPGDRPIAEKVDAVLKATGKKAEELAHREASELGSESKSESTQPQSRPDPV
jgi:hypothetical protein